MIYTSYFGKTKKILEQVPDAMFVSIAGKTPDWFNGKKYSALAPKYSWWKEWHDMFKDDLESEKSREWYAKKYEKTVLRDLDPLQTARDLKDLCDWKPTFILCYETPEKFCHRHLVCDWLNKHKIECEEYAADEQ